MRHVKRTLTLLIALVFLFSPMPATSAEEVSASTGDTAVSAESAVGTAATVTRVQEIEFLREKNSETYLLSDGKFECVVYADNKYYMDANEELKLIDNTIVRSQNTGPLASEANKGAYKNAANEFDIFFGDATEPKVDIKYQGKAVTFAPLTATRKDSGKELRILSLGKVENCATLEKLTATGKNTVSYKNVFTGTDLVYVLENNALKEYMVLSSADAANTYSFLFTLDGVKLQASEKYAQFVDETGNAIFALDSLFAIDANGVLTEELSYSFTPVQDTNNVVVTVTLDEAYIKSSDRAFPVVIDPTIVISSWETADTCVCSYYPNTNYQMAMQLRTGFDVDYGKRRSYIKFNIPESIPGGSVTGATLALEKISGSAPTMRAYMCSSSWSSGTVTWANVPTYLPLYVSNISSAYGGAWYAMDVSAIVENWVNGRFENYGFLLKDENEGNINHWTTLYSSDVESPHKPELRITYSPLVFYHYYDSSITNTQLNTISTAVNVANTAYNNQFGFEFATKGSPQYNTSLTSGSHKDIISIANTINSYARDVNEIKVFWTDRSNGFYCSHETGVCQPIDNVLAAVYRHRPVIHILDILPYAGSNAIYEMSMSLLLIHETAHTFGMDDVADRENHAPGDSCVMGNYSNDQLTNNFYNHLKNGTDSPFCNDCEIVLLDLIYS